MRCLAIVPKWVSSASPRPQSSVSPTEPDPPSAAPLSPSQDNGTCLHSDSEDGHESKPGFSKPGHSSGHSKRHYRQRSASPGEDRGRDKGKDRDRHKKSQRDGERDRDRRKERDEEREDRPRGRREDKDRRKDRARETERDSGQHRGKEDRQERREKSPKERRREEEEEEKRKGKRGSPPEQQQKEEKERMKDSVTDRAIKPEATDKEGGDRETKSGGMEIRAEDGGSQGEERGSKFAKRSSDHTVSSARERYLARQMARSGSKAYIEKEED